ncbi:hypothetical protein [Egicoccus halophilus]|uniref:Uncharacterized protein n=1 Tax=Egicoccus halophilus TaxID=1670830 RepID=A0A8J3A9P9_9ACTN|nr:hypothetical protein [Egicoccus halophilus]GGI07918.1 hypothetical protein GCM10011354_26480 [Egicoccus halophilus]
MTEDVTALPSRAMWACWGLVLAGGIAVVAAAAAALLDPCTRAGACTPDSLVVAGRLALLGTALAVAGIGGCAWVFLHRR